MRTVLALILEWLMPARGKRRRPAEGAVRNTTPAGTPMRRLIITHGAARVGHPGHPTTFIEADGLPLVRPYVIAHEREQVRRRQRDRRRAAVPATLGQNCPAGVAA